MFPISTPRMCTIPDVSEVPDLAGPRIITVFLVFNLFIEYYFMLLLNIVYANKKLNVLPIILLIIAPSNPYIGMSNKKIIIWITGETRRLAYIFFKFPSAVNVVTKKLNGKAIRDKEKSCDSFTASI